LCNLSKTQKQQKTGNWHCGISLIGWFWKMHKNAMKCNETLSKWCKNKHGASKIIDTLETYQQAAHPQPEDHSIEQSCPESPAPEVRSLWPIPESPGLDTRVSGGHQGPDEDPSEFCGYGTLDDQGNPTIQGED
jgi:hypothetical protein